MKHINVFFFSYQNLFHQNNLIKINRKENEIRIVICLMNFYCIYYVKHFIQNTFNEQIIVMQ